MPLLQQAAFVKSQFVLFFCNLLGQVSGGGLIHLLCLVNLRSVQFDTAGAHVAKQIVMRFIGDHGYEKQREPLSDVQEPVKAAVLAIPAFNGQSRSKIIPGLTSPAEQKKHCVSSPGKPMALELEQEVQNERCKFTTTDSDRRPRNVSCCINAEA